MAVLVVMVMPLCQFCIIRTFVEKPQGRNWRVLSQGLIQHSCFTYTLSVPNYKQKNSFSLSQVISKTNQLLSYLIMLFQKIIFSKGKLNPKCIQFALSFIFSITNNQWKLFLHLPIKLISRITQETLIQTTMF